MKAKESNAFYKVLRNFFAGDSSENPPEYTAVISMLKEEPK